MLPLVVMHTNVLAADLRSRQGASFALLQQLGRNRFKPVVSVPLVLEYEDVLNRPGMVPVTPAAIDAVLNMICRQSVHQKLNFLWRPQLRDADDEMVLETAANAGASHLITHNLSDFAKVRCAGLAIVTPSQFLREFKIGAQP